MPEKKKRSTSDHMQLVIGFAECVDLVDWGVERLRAKIDTGARSSALHISDLEELGDGKVAFTVVPDPGRSAVREPVRVEAPIHRTGRVRSSSGEAETRHFVLTTLRVGPMEFEVEVSLASRGEMRYRMLLGRSALRGRFLIDVGRRYTTGAPPARRRRKKRKGISE